MLAQARGRVELGVLERVLVALRAQRHANGRAGHIKMLTQPVHQIAAVAVGHIFGVRTHDDKARRAGFDLRHIAHPNALAAGGWRRMRFGL